MPRSWAEKAYSTSSTSISLRLGNHFAAWQAPQLFSEELRADFRSLRLVKRLRKRAYRLTGQGDRVAQL